MKKRTLALILSALTAATRLRFLLEQLGWQLRRFR